MVEASPLNRHIRGEGRVGVITYGSGSMLMEEYRARVDPSLDILSLAFSNPLPMERIRAFVRPSPARCMSLRKAAVLCRTPALRPGLR